MCPVHPGAGADGDIGVRTRPRVQQSTHTTLLAAAAHDAASAWPSADPLIEPGELTLDVLDVRKVRPQRELQHIPRGPQFDGMQPRPARGLFTLVSK